MPALLDLVLAPFDKSWADLARATLEAVARDRYGNKWDKRLQIRVNGADADDAAPFAAFIPAGQPKSGPYGGTSFVLFPAPGAPALVALVVGTNGLAPDEQVLGRPGHARKTHAICHWLNARAHRPVAWAKRDPVRIDLPMSRELRKSLEPYANAVEKYDRVIYATLAAAQCPLDVLRDGANAFLDLLAEEREVKPLKAADEEIAEARDRWLSHALPATSEAEVLRLLQDRRFVILEGPPGTGKTRLALHGLLPGPFFKGHGRTIQFHPSTTYETFIGGLAPVTSSQELGLKFAPRPGHLMEAAAEALKDPGRPYLLHIDEINRADLAKVLGEAILLFEPDDPDRSVELAYDFGPPFHRTLRLPRNLHVLGTMNSADRSIAILDIAVRRRFAFVPMWPDLQVLQAEGASDRMRDAFKKLFSIFLEEATDDAFSLMPGHAYFLDHGKDPNVRLRTGLRPLLAEYLAQGYVNGFADSIRAYQDELEALE